MALKNHRLAVPPASPPAGALAVRGQGYLFIDYATQAYQLIVGLLVLGFHGNTVPQWPWLVAAHATGLVVVHGLIRAHAIFPANRLLDFLRHFYPVLLYTGFFCETSEINLMFVPRYLDPEFIGLEQWVFGFQPSLEFMDKFPYLAVSELFYFSYFCYYLMISGVGVALYLRNRSEFFHYVTVVSFIFYICYLVYIFLPVIGPRVFFHDFPGYSAPAPLPIQPAPSPAVFPAGLTGGPFFRIMAFVYANFGSTGAAFPSSHIAVAICTLYFSFRYLARIRWMHSVAVVLLAFATVYCRYHYAVDILAGIATALVLLPLANWIYYRKHQSVKNQEPRNPGHP